jgi:hypothetical protein
MKTGMKRTLWGGAAAGAVALMVAGAAFFPTIAQAQDATSTATPTVGVAAPDFQQRGRGAPNGPLGERVDQSAALADALADALGITAEELQAAQTEAQIAAIDQLVADDLLTATQADALKTQMESGSGRMGGMGRGFGHLGDSDIDYDALLANALDITVADLDAARTQVFDDQLAQAVRDGSLTQEEADLMQARRALADYMAPRLEAAYADALAAAVSDGIITQEQADALVAQGSRGLRGFGPGMNDGIGRRGGMDAMGGRMGPGGQGERGGRGGSDIAPDMTTPDDAPAEESAEGNS